VIGSILFIGTLIMTIGNAVISGLDTGLALHFRQQLCGDIVVISSDQIKENVFFIPMGEAVESINQLDEVLRVVTQNNNVRVALPVAKGIVFVLNEDGEPYFQMLLGVRFNDYYRAFPDGISVVEGHLPTGNTRGLLLSTKSRDELLTFSNTWPVPKGETVVTANLPAGITPNTVTIKSEIIFMGYSDRDTSLDIISTVNAIISYPAFNQLWGYFSIIDIDSYNECNGYYQPVPSAKISAKDRELLANYTHLDDILFGGTPPSHDAIADIPPPQTERVKSGYNLILVKIDTPDAIESVVHEINHDLSSHNLPARAITWKAALGQVAQMAFLMRAVLFGFVTIVFLVAIIVITNTLSLAAMERVSEIGMMRAIGAQRRFVSLMFVAETSFLSIIFGGLGIGVGVISIGGLQHMTIRTSNRLVELFFGGPVFRPMITATDIGLGLLQLGVVTVVAVIYPIYIARRISPNDAISRD